MNAVDERSAGAGNAGATRGVLSRLLPCLCLVAALQAPVLAQDVDITDGQFWTDARATYRFSGVTRLSGDVGVRTVFSDEQDWTRYNSRWRFSGHALDWLQLTGGVFFDYTNWENSPNTMEIRPTSGVRVLVYWPTRRFRLDSYTRLEYRFFFVSGQPDEKFWRFRTRLGGTVAINRNTLLADRTLFLILDIEPFVSIDEAFTQEFADQLRLRLGLGYRYSYNWRFELVYTAQRSRITREDQFDITDHIMRLRLKYFIN